MIINPQRAIDEGWVKDTGVEPTSTSILLTLDRIWLLRIHNPFRVYDNVGMKTRGADWVEPVPDRADPEKRYWRLEMGNYYQCESDVLLDLPPGIGVMIHALPEMVENGVIVPPTFYDGGWRKPVGFTMDIRGGHFYTSPGTQVASAMFVVAGSQFA